MNSVRYIALPSSGLAGVRGTMTNLFSVCELSPGD
jgi:hypothetical protein